MDRHPTTKTWELPGEREPLEAPLRRVNLRSLEARPDRFEHHLMVVGRVGDAQIEIATASEPLYFAHRNISDELAVPLRTGDPMLDGFPFRTFFSDFDSGDDVGRVKHRVRQLLLHPYGFLHWPGRLRLPYEPFEFAEGMRRSGLTMVYCASRPSEPDPDRPLFVSEGNDGACKAYADVGLPFHLADLATETAGVVARVAGTVMELTVDPDAIAPGTGGYVVVIEADGAGWVENDLVYVPPGASLGGDGIRRAVVVYGDDEPEPPPSSWDAAPLPPFAVYEDAAPGALPVEVAGVRVSEASSRLARVEIAGESREVPRYWLARFLFRTALHEFRLGYLETYGGFTYDDGAGGDVKLGLRGGESVTIARADAAGVVETLYRAVAPAGYVERIA